MRFRRGAKLDPSQVEDYRGQGGRGMGTPLAVGGGGLAGIIVVIVLLISAFTGGGGLGDLGALEDQAIGTGQPPAGSAASECQTGEQANVRDDCRIVGFVNSIQSFWSQGLRGYEPARTRFFDGSINTACGPATSAVGPFYCPADRYVYIDLGFFDQLQSDFGAQGGPLAEAYVSRTSMGITSRTCSATCRTPSEAARAPRVAPSGSSSRPTATPGCGRGTRFAPGSSRT